MKRRVFNVLAALSLLLCVGICSLWVRSYRHGDFVSIFHSGSARQFASCQGSLYLQSCPTSYPDGVTWSVQMPYYLIINGLVDRYHRFLHSEWMTGVYPNGTPQRFWVIAVPYWFLALLLLVLPARWLWRRRSHVRVDHCAKCGYDLRATPDRCPECGTIQTKIPANISSPRA